jgi:hypothetical protein
MKIKADSVLIKVKPDHIVKTKDLLSRDRYQLYAGDTCYLLKELDADRCVLLHVTRDDNFIVFTAAKSLIVPVSKNVTVEIPDYFAELTDNPGVAGRRPIKI